MKKFVKYTSRIVLGLFTIFLGLATYFAYTPDESYHHCEAGQNDGNPVYVALIAIASLLVFCFVWNKTRKW
jgi:O-antigen/teichoic acid export membrane protein